MAKDDLQNAQHLECPEQAMEPCPKGDTVGHGSQFEKRVTCKVDMRLLPLCAFAYLLNYLDRSNLGNGKILNQETGDSLLQKTGMNSAHYSIVLTVFGVAYTVFDIPANWVMKRYVRPSRWLGLLMFLWGVVTLGFGWARNFTTVLVLRFFIGVFEAGFFPGKQPGRALLRQTNNKCSSRHRVLDHLLVCNEPAVSPHCLRARIGDSCWSLWGLHRLRRRALER